MMRIAVVGAGGCAREVAWTIQSAAQELRMKFIGYVVTDLSRLTELDSRNEILGDLTWLEARQSDIDGLVIGIGSPSNRRSVYATIESRIPGMRWPAVLHPSAHFDRRSATVEEGVVVCASVTATVNLRLRRHSMVHYGSTIGHESEIGEFSVLNPGARLAGGVRIGDASMIGSGAVILQYRSVGDAANVGAGAVVTHDVPAGETWVGVPAGKLAREDA